MKGRIRGVLGVVVGYAIYVVGLMQLVMFWFVRGSGLSGIGPHVVNVIALLVLGWVTGWTTAWVSGGRSWALLGLAIVIAAVGVLNLSLGVAVEPAWYTVMVVLIVGVVLVLHRTRLRTRSE